MAKSSEKRKDKKDKIKNATVGTRSDVVPPAPTLSRTCDVSTDDGRAGLGSIAPRSNTPRLALVVPGSWTALPLTVFGVTSAMAVRLVRFKISPEGFRCYACIEINNQMRWELRST